MPSSVVVDTAQAHPATPAAPAMATPKPAPSPLMATPRPSVVAVPTPPPASPSPTASLDPAASPVATPTPDRYKKTTVATDLAVSGPGFFVLATKPNPASAADLLFTRNGHFKLVHDTAGALSLWRLRHATFDFYAAGYMIAGGTGAGAPSETSASDHAELATSWGGLDTTLGGVVIDAERNTDALTTARFDFTGRLLLGELAPRGADGGPVQVYVGVAQVAEPSQLVAQPGFAGVYKYVPAAGALQLGVATSGDGRPVGNANLILTSTLEQENGSSTAKP
ncbi:MAG: hypothetical protein JWM80_2259 [Cyanobacteria bacterium RYN_339]|nr:hypothetical protein [Cyanobacteria bacterium RYN_339]